ncbi:MAG TPA: dephospho-CoA kinase [Lentisphaeria bacterium]|nr:MAG: dephospho-CoA kinase [Lentisphaerae bacterium GWF2_50_93]HCE44302.1 dephospho-CoA kinase [Lentisphaeria bacterium]
MFVGLTGGTGCGKSTALECFSSLGWKTLDADGICYELYGDRNSGVAEAIRRRWGDRVFSGNGDVDRKKVADIVFRSRKERLWLNSLLHPMVLERAVKEARKSKNRNVIFAVPLLFEAKWEKEFDCTVSIWTDRKTQYQRLAKRGWSLEEIERRCKCQITPDEKMELADFAIINNGGIDLLYQQCKILNKDIRKNYGKKQ